MKKKICLHHKLHHLRDDFEDLFCHYISWRPYTGPNLVVFVDVVFFASP